MRNSIIKYLADALFAGSEYLLLKRDCAEYRLLKDFFFASLKVLPG